MKEIAWLSKTKKHFIPSLLWECLHRVAFVIDSGFALFLVNLILQHVCLLCFRKSSSSGLMQVPQCQQIGGDTGSQKSSTFYCNISETASTSRSLSPVESVDSESSLSPENQSPGHESSQAPVDDRKREIQEARSPTTENESEKPTAISDGNIGMKTEAIRPMNLSLPEHEAKPPRLKRIAKMKQSKREGRLLSVPNLKFSKNESTVCDLRCEESATTESFTGNLIRRFSKCLTFNVEERYVSSVCP